MDVKVSQYIEQKPSWKGCLERLREIILSLPLKETIKWGVPYYTYNDSNIIGLAAFKNYVGIWFVQGALLKDTQSVLINAQEGKTSALRQLRFSSENEIHEELITSYVLEAIENLQQGKKITPQKKPLIIPDLLQKQLDTNPQLKDRFKSFTLTKKREYAEYILDAKRERTKESRLKKIIPMILEGIGLNDKYRKD